VSAIPISLVLILAYSFSATYKTNMYWWQWSMIKIDTSSHQLRIGFSPFSYSLNSCFLT
jgi:hypothetical protein